jgi:hypothetical protein
LHCFVSGHAEADSRVDNQSSIIAVNSSNRPRQRTKRVERTEPMTAALRSSLIEAGLLPSSACRAQASVDTLNFVDVPVNGHLYVY